MERLESRVGPSALRENARPDFMPLPSPEQSRSTLQQRIDDWWVDWEDVGRRMNLREIKPLAEDETVSLESEIEREDDIG